MKARTPDAHVFRFGGFELDARLGELRRHGLEIRLPEQSFQVLQALLMRPGELVTRDELRQLLWTSDTFVDVEVGLNSAVRKLREALDDSADQPAVRRDGAAPRVPLRRAGHRANRRSGAGSGHGVRQARRAGFSAAVRGGSGLAPRVATRTRAGQAPLAHQSLACGRALVRLACRDRGVRLHQRTAHAQAPQWSNNRSGPWSCSRSRT